MEKYLCIDLSRTKLRYAIVTEGLDVVAEGNEYIGINNREEVFGPILNVTDRYRDEIEGVSITMPGVIDPKRGIAYSGGVFGMACAAGWILVVMIMGLTLMQMRLFREEE